MPQINLPHGVVTYIARVPLAAKAVKLLESVGAVYGLEWSEGNRAALIRHLMATHPDVVRTAKAQGMSKAEVVKMFGIRRGVRTVLSEKGDEK